MANGRGPSFVTIASAVVFMVGIGAVSAAFLGPVVFNDDSATTTSTATTVTPDLGTAAGAVEVFAAALESGDLLDVPFASVAAPTATDDYDNTIEGLGEFTLEIEPGSPEAIGDRLSRAPLLLTWTFAEGVEWTTTTEVTMEEVSGEWRVRWTPAVLESSLVSGDRLRRERIAPSRGEVLGRDGSVLISEANVVRIGIRPSRVQDLPTLVADVELILDPLVDVDPADISARVTAASPDDFVEVTVLAREQYETIREQIFPLPGTVFAEDIRPVAGDPTLARAVLGRSGEVTAEVIDANPGLFAPGDLAGLSGLQELYNPVLTGTPGVEVSVLRTAIDPSSTTTGTGFTTTSALRDPTLPETLAIIDPVDGQQLVTTIDPAIQAAAEAALDRRPETSALVAVEVSTGELVAVANGPRNSSVNNAMNGQYPPGSIFKIISAYALLERGLSPADAVDCPQSLTVQGRTFANAGGFELGIVPFRIAFALSCNTAFVGTTTGFDFETLSATGSQFGLGDESPIGAPAFTGNVPVNDDSVDLAAASFGQGRVLFSPMAAAVMAATSADGVYRSPRLITSPSPGPQTVTQLSPRAAADLRGLMRAVVTEGSAPSVVAVPGGPVAGKTGTAEFGNANPPQSHAWFVGFQGNIAFAVFVEAGESGGGVAAPVAADFLNRLAAAPPTSPAPTPDDADSDSTSTSTSTETTLADEPAESTTTSPADVTTTETSSTTASG